ncbi:hypothetical protein WT83_10705 [Burkholderia territorii]|uniref:DUF4019 domain-containing protein n=2 Tax=Burkholderia territorii TaxID=1503055 RepID=A0A108EXJ7_9BURK|nr:DUF4019 domain-containing protein [Burkholderia territorii]KAB0660296.1 DUF4019 domain-containing protein [Burkholderia territorii]KWN19313.1 hypothetical protein WT83_10705 [Burkholderia territorii]MBM2777408.1 DUF4019 domain-containing protein [Burkholderia territorii]VWB91637.1 membrane protein [Burkholderia territorii]
MNAHLPLSRTKWLIGCAVASIAMGAHAQSDGESADALLRDADAVFKQLDAGQYGAVWNDAAAFVKARIKQDQFALDMQRARQSVGMVGHRGWAQITRIRYTNSSSMPDGLYANIDYATTLTTGTTVYEKLSFRLGDDGRWHLTGYVPRQSQNYTP